MSRLTINVAAVVDAPDAVAEFHLQEPMVGLRTALAWIQDDEHLQIDVRAESIVEGVLVSGPVSGGFHLACARCLKEYRESFRIQVHEIYAARGAGEGEYALEQGPAGVQIDLEPMVRDAIVLAMPLSPLHDAQCRGLCAHCGMDLNEGDCGHGTREVDSRLSALGQLLERQVKE